MAKMPSGELSQLLMRYIGLSENGIAILNADDRFLFYNQAFEDISGFIETSMLGRHHDGMMTWMSSNHLGAKIEWLSLDASLEHVHSRHRSESFRSFEVDLRDSKWLLLNEKVLDGGEMLVISTDIIKKKRIELELRVAQADLERLAMADELTGIPNRRYFMQHWVAENGRPRR